MQRWSIHSEIFLARALVAEQAGCHEMAAMLFAAAVDMELELPEPLFSARFSRSLHNKGDIK